jgi:CBS domain-containing protein
MTAPVVSVSADMGLHDVAQRMLEHGIGGVPVVDDSGNLLGIITESDFVGKEGYVPFTPFRMPQLFGQWMPQQDVEAIYRTARTMKARDIMSTPVFSTVEDEPVSELAQRMVERNITRMPVVRGTTLVGMVSRHDLLRLLLDDHLGSTPGDVDKIGTLTGHRVAAHDLDGAARARMVNAVTLRAAAAARSRAATGVCA